jgi:hypothetical protein
MADCASVMPYLAIALLVIVAGWWFLSRVRVSPAPAAMMPTRIAFPALRISNLEASLAALERPEDVVIPFEHAVLVIDYPLTNAATVEISAPLKQGFTREALVRAIIDEYDNIYEAEEGTAQTKTVPRDERSGLANRNRTDGVYGIYGHDLEDLVLTAARWTRGTDGSVRVELSVES